MSAPFDVERASFWLVAFVIVIYAIMVLGAGTLCVFYADQVIHEKFVCDRDSRLSELLAAALAAALAFAGRRNREGDK